MIEPSISTNGSLNTMNIFVLIILLTIDSHSLSEISNSLGHTVGGIKSMAKVHLFTTLLLLSADYILIFWWFLREVIREMNVFYTGVFLIILLAIIPAWWYICNKGQWLYKFICEQTNNQHRRRECEHEDSLPLTTIQLPEKF